MATLDELVAKGDLKKVRIKLGFPDVERRSIYILPRVENWIRSELQELTSFEPSDIPPMQQAFALFRMFISGEALSEGDMFRLMRPVDQDVYELKTPDTRFFGWFVRAGIFIVAVADTMERVHSVDGLSSRYRDQVLLTRSSIDLDPPKYLEGASIEHVFSI